METRTDLTDLRERHDPLTARFTDLRTMLDEPPLSKPGGIEPDPVRRPTRLNLPCRRVRSDVLWTVLTYPR